MSIGHKLLDVLTRQLLQPAQAPAVSAAKFDCRACGACCISDCDGDPFVYVTTKSIRRLSGYYQRKLVNADGRRQGDRMYLPVVRDVTRNTVCAALRGEAGTRVRCGIYERRPDACRDFRPGAPACLQARRELIESGQMTATEHDR